VKRFLAVLLLLSAVLAACGRAGPLPSVTPEEAGLSWRECAVSSFDLAQAEACLGLQRPYKSDAERARLGTRGATGLHLTLGGDTYETRHLGLGFIPAWPWDPYVLLKNGRPLSLLLGEFQVYDPDRSLQEIAGQAAWEFADPRQATVIYGGRDLRRVYGLEAAYAPYELGGRLAFIGKRDGRSFLVCDGRQVGPAFDEITIAYCCEIMLYSAGGGEGRYRFWGRRGDQLYVVEVAVPPLPRGFKGYELYSWREGGEWRFTLITGTNRNKSCAEIAAAGEEAGGDGWVRIGVKGAAAIKGALARLPQGESVFWLDQARWGDEQGCRIRLERPDPAIVDDIVGQCERLGVELHGL